MATKLRLLLPWPTFHWEPALRWNPIASCAVGITVGVAMVCARFSIGLAGIDEPFASEAVYWSEIRKMWLFFLLSTVVLSAWLITAAALCLRVSNSKKAVGATCLSPAGLILPGAIWCVCGAIADMEGCLSSPTPEWVRFPLFAVFGNWLWLFAGLGYLAYAGRMAFKRFPQEGAGVVAQVAEA